MNHSKLPASDLQLKGWDHSLKTTEEKEIRKIAEELKEEPAGNETAENFIKISTEADAGTEKDRKKPDEKKAEKGRKVQELKKLLLLHGQDILFAPGMQQEKQFMQHGKVSVFEHSVGVTLVCLMLADTLKMKIDIRSLIRGSLLHDYFLYDWHDPHPEVGLHGFTHAKTAMENASRDFELNEIEKDMIARHMFPLNLKPPKYRESILLCVADKLAATCETFRIPFLEEVIRELREAV